MDIKVDDNFYYHKNESYVRVTQVLNIISKPELYYWYAKHGYKECERIKKERRIFGSKFHKCVYDILENKSYYVEKEYPLYDELTETIDLFKDWAKKFNIKPLYLEEAMVHDKLAYAGTVDFIGEIDGVKCIVDWKTSKDVYKSHFIQLSAYLELFYHNHKGEYDIEQGIVVSMRDGKIKAEDIDADRLRIIFNETFLPAKKLYDGLRNVW